MRLPQARRIPRLIRRLHVFRGVAQRAGAIAGSGDRSGSASAEGRKKGALAAEAKVKKDEERTKATDLVLAASVPSVASIH